MKIAIVNMVLEQESIEHAVRVTIERICFLGARSFDIVSFDTIGEVTEAVVNRDVHFGLIDIGDRDLSDFASRRDDIYVEAVFRYRGYVLFDAFRIESFRHKDKKLTT